MHLHVHTYMYTTAYAMNMTIWTLNTRGPLKLNCWSVGMDK